MPRYILEQAEREWNLSIQSKNCLFSYGKDKLVGTYPTWKDGFDVASLSKGALLEIKVNVRGLDGRRLRRASYGIQCSGLTWGYDSPFYTIGQSSPSLVEIIQLAMQEAMNAQANAHIVLYIPPDI